VRIPRAFNAAAIARCVLAPVASICRTIGRTFAAKASAAARFTAMPFACASNKTMDEFEAARAVLTDQQGHCGIRTLQRHAQGSDKPVTRKLHDRRRCRLPSGAAVATTGRSPDWIAQRSDIRPIWGVPNVQTHRAGERDEGPTREH
jgi:hypothetical protein